MQTKSCVRAEGETFRVAETFFFHKQLVAQVRPQIFFFSHSRALHSYHPSAFVQVSSSSRDRKRPAGQFCIGEAFSKLAKYEQDSCKWKMLTRNLATYAAIPIPQRACADEELTRPLAGWWNSELCRNTAGSSLSDQGTAVSHSSLSTQN